MRLETTILKNLIYNEEYTRKVLPFLSVNYFQEREDKILYEKIDEYINQYNTLPTQEALAIELDKSSIKDEEFQNSLKLLESITNENDEANISWLLDSTEKFCQDRAIYNAVVESISILDEKGRNTRDKGSIPDILSDALSVSFDPHVGHDYFLDADERYKFYHRIEEKIPWDLEFFNRITKGGLSNKTLNIALAGTGVGKSLFMCHVAASCLSQNYNVLYITLEMAEEKIAERIDANLLNISIDDLQKLPKDLYDKKINKLKKIDHTL